MANTKDKLLDRTGNARPYVERALTDEQLRQNVRNAFESARDVYNELIGGRGAIPLATRVATDKEIQERLREAIEELREAADRVQGKKEHGARNTLLLLTGIALGWEVTAALQISDDPAGVRQQLRELESEGLVTRSVRQKPREQEA